MKRHYGYDADSTLSLVQTSTGIWTVTYNAQNRAVKFESADGSAIITCAYDYAGRRFKKQVVSNGTITTHQRFIYRGYLQVAAVNLKEDAPTPDLWFLIWDPTQSVATRPLALRKDGVWYTYGWDLTKNICELYGQEGYIRTIYRYSPYGTVTAEGDVTQPIQWSSEYYDNDLGLVYYNYRYYNPQDGRWTRRDPIGTLGGKNLYSTRILVADFIGLAPKGCNSVINAVNSLYKKLFSRDLPKDTRLLERWFISNILPYILEGENPWAPSFWADQYNPYDEKKTYRNYTQWLESRLTDTLNTAEQNLIDKINSQLEEKCKEENKNNTTINLTEIKFPVNNEVINKSQDANYTLSERYLDIGSFVLRVRNLNIQWNEVDRTFSWNAEVYAEDDTGANDPNGDSNDPRVILDCLALTYSDHFKPRKMEFARFPIHGSKSCDC